MLLHKAIQRSLLGAMAFAVPRGAIGRPLELPADDLHNGLSRRQARLGLAVCCASIALRTVDCWAPSAEGPPSSVLLWPDRRLQGDEIEALDVADGSRAGSRRSSFVAPKLPVALR